MAPFSISATIQATRYLSSGEYSDFVIKCGEATFNVHRPVLGASSEYFAKAFSTRFRGHQSTTFTDDDVKIMARMIIFSTPETTHASKTASQSRECSTKSLQPLEEAGTNQVGGGRSMQIVAKDMDVSERHRGTPLTENNHHRREAPNADLLSLHASVYSIAEKYGVEALKELSCHRYLDSLATRIEPHHFINSIDIINTATFKSDDLRKAVAWRAYRYRVGLRDLAEFKQLCHRESAFRSDFLAHHRAVDGVWYDCCGEHYAADEH